MKNLNKVIYKNRLIAFILKANFREKGLHFFTPNEFSQQLAYMNRPKGHIINSHIHSNPVREIKSHQEVIFVRSGKVRVDFYDNKKHYIESRILKEGDIVFIAEGGHGFRFLEDSELIEVKQGPFSPIMEALKFDFVPESKLKVKK